MTKVVASFGSRLNEALEARGMRPVDLANKADISEATISQYRSGYAKPKYERIVRIADALNVSLPWLMGADVPMEKDRTIPPLKHLGIEVDAKDESFVDRALRYYQIYESLSPEKKAAFENYLKFLLSDI